MSFNISMCSVFPQPLRVRVFGAFKIPATCANRQKVKINQCQKMSVIPAKLLFIRCLRHSPDAYEEVQCSQLLFVLRI